MDFELDFRPWGEHFITAVGESDDDPDLVELILSGVAQSDADPGAVVYLKLTKEQAARIESVLIVSRAEVLVAPDEVAQDHTET